MADKAVALAREGLDEVRVGGVVIERLADLADAVVEAGVEVNMDAAAPDVVAKLFPGDDCGSACEQELKDAKRLRLEFEPEAFAGQHGALRIEFKAAKADRR